MIVARRALGVSLQALFFCATKCSVPAGFIEASDLAVVILKIGVLRRLLLIAGPGNVDRTAYAVALISRAAQVTSDPNEREARSVTGFFSSVRG